MLRLGSSKPWPEALKQMTGTSHMDVEPLVEYFQPLLDWLEIQNAGHPTGWTEECPQQELVEAAQWLQDFDKKFEEIRVESTFADWNYTSNITDETSAKSVCPLFYLSASPTPPPPQPPLSVCLPLPLPPCPLSDVTERPTELLRTKH